MVSVLAPGCGNDAGAPGTWTASSTGTDGSPDTSSSQTGSDSISDTGTGSGSTTDAVDCPELVVNGDVEVTSPEELALLEGVTHVTGVLQITGLAAPDLEPLSCLEHVGSIRVEENPELLSLRGLDRLALADDRVQINRLDGIESLEGLGRLESAYLIVVGSCPKITSLEGLGAVKNATFSIAQNHALESLEGLDSLEFSASFSVHSNAVLENLGGLPQADIRSLSAGSNPMLSSTEGAENITNLDSLVLDSNERLVSLAGFANLREIVFTGGGAPEGIGARLVIRDNDALESLMGLDALEVVEGYVVLENNGSLADLDGLASVERIDDYLLILGNAMLSSVGGLRTSSNGSLQTLGGWVSIGVNHSLPDCDAKGLVEDLEALGYDGSVEIWDNLPDECTDDP